jgi:hypothetical protein
MWTCNTPTNTLAGITAQRGSQQLILALIYAEDANAVFSL